MMRNIDGCACSQYKSRPQIRRVTQKEIKKTRRKMLFLSYFLHQKIKTQQAPFGILPTIPNMIYIIISFLTYFLLAQASPQRGGGVTSGPENCLNKDGRGRGSADKPTDMFHTARHCDLSNSPCPSDELCFDAQAGTLLRSRSGIGTCFARQCTDNYFPSLSPMGSAPGCRQGQPCVHKVARQQQPGRSVRSAKGYCLLRLPCDARGSCQNGWECVRDVSDPEGLGFCSPAILAWE
jgi:hypothetical protein